MLLVNTEHVPGHEVVRVLGLVRGNTIRAKHVFKDVMAGLRSLVGGEVKEYVEMLAEARAEALRRLEKDAESLGANAVVNIRFVTAQVMAGAAEMLAYGTAVVLEPAP